MPNSPLVGHTHVRQFINPPVVNCDCCLLQKDVLVVSCDLITDVGLHHLADIHRSYDSTLSVLLAPVLETSADREAANNPKAKKKTNNSGKR